MKTHEGFLMQSSFSRYIIRDGLEVERGSLSSFGVYVEDLIELT